MTKIEDEQLTLAAHLEDFFTLCVRHRDSIGMTQRLYEARLQAKSQYSPGVIREIAQRGENNIFIPLTNLKIRATVAWVINILVPSRDKLWELAPDPIPEMPQAAVDRVREDLRAELVEVLREGGTEEDFDTIAEDVVVNEAKKLREEAEKHIVPMSMLIQDQLHEGGFDAALSQALIDLYTSYGIIKGPILEKEWQLVYSKGSSTPRKKAVVIPKIKRIDPSDVYFSPDIGSDINRGTGIFERVVWSKPDLLLAKSIKNSGYIISAIEDIFEEHPDGVKVEIDGTQVKFDALDGKDLSTQEQQDIAAGGYEGFEYQGLVDNWRLKDAGYDFEGDEEFGMTETVFAVLAGRIIYYRPNKNPRQWREYMITPYYPRAGSYSGDEFFTEIISPYQRIVNAANRNLLVNMAFASGPIGEVDMGRLAPGQTMEESVKPRHIYNVTAGGHGEQAYRFTELNSKSPEFIRLIEYYFRQTDDFTIPAFVYGAPASGGGASTLGGMTMLYDNASKSVQSTLTNIGKFWIEPLITRFYDYNMVNSNRPEIKGPANVVVKSMSGLVQKEFKRNMLLQGLNLVTQYMQVLPDHVKSEHAALLFREVLESLGIDPDSVSEDPKRVAELARLSGASPEALAELSPEGIDSSNLVSSQEGTPPPEIDGRSIPTPGPV